MNTISKESFFTQGLAAGKSFKQIELEWKESGFSLRRKRGFRAAYYEALANGDIQNLADADAFIEDSANGASENDAKQSNRGHWHAIAELVFAVREG